MVCIAFYTNPGSEYPVVDPLRASAGPLPHHYAYYLAWDTVEIIVEDDPTTHFNACSMRVVLTTDASVTSDKSIVGWNFFNSNAVGEVRTSGNDHGPHEMIVQRGNCGAGAATLLLRKAMWFNVMTGLYIFNSDDLWTYWGGKKVTINWAADNSGSNVWGPDTPEPDYSIHNSSRVVESLVEPGIFFIQAGGGFFRIGSQAAAGVSGISTSGAPTEVVRLGVQTPVDFTLLQEIGSPRIYVTFGGAKFVLPDLATFGFTAGEVNHVPPGALAAVGDMPRDGTLLRERPRQHVAQAAPGPGLIDRPTGTRYHLPDDDGRVFLVIDQQLRWITGLDVFDRMCLSWRNVRTVPHGSLSRMPRGQDLR